MCLCCFTVRKGSVAVSRNWPRRARAPLRADSTLFSKFFLRPRPSERWGLVQPSNPLNYETNGQNPTEYRALPPRHNARFVVACPIDLLCLFDLWPFGGERGDNGSRLVLRITFLYLHTPSVFPRSHMGGGTLGARERREGAQTDDVKRERQETFPFPAFPARFCDELSPAPVSELPTKAARKRPGEGRATCSWKPEESCKRRPDSRNQKLWP